MPDRPRRGGRTGGGADERAAAALTGGGPSQLGVEASMRARDVSRPRMDDVAAAQRLVQVSYRPSSQPRVAPAGRRPVPRPPAQPGTGGSSPESS